MAGGEWGILAIPPDLVVKPDADRRHQRRSGADLELIIITGGAAVLGGRLHHRKRDTVRFHRAVGPAGGAEPVASADLEPDQIVGVVDNAHLIRFCIADADAGGPDRRRRHTRMPPAAALFADVRRLRVAASASEEPKIAWPA